MYFFRIVILVYLFTSCSPDKTLDGSYYYRGSLPNQPESSLVREAKKEMKKLTGQDGLYTAFIFKGKNTVMVKTMDMEFAASYKRDGDYITVSATDGELILKVINQNTLHGEGFASGLYTKLKPGEKIPVPEKRVLDLIE